MFFQHFQHSHERLHSINSMIRSDLPIHRKKKNLPQELDNIIQNSILIAAHLSINKIISFKIRLKRDLPNVVTIVLMTNKLEWASVSDRNDNLKSNKWYVILETKKKMYEKWILILLSFMIRSLYSIQSHAEHWNYFLTVTTAVSMLCV